MLIAKQNRKKIALTIGLILLALLGWLVYQKYLKPTYNLNQLVPDNYQISLELSLDHYNFPTLEQNKLLQNKGVSSIYGQISRILDNSLNQLPDNEAKSIIKNSEQGLIFFKDQETFGLIFKIPFTKNSKKISKINFEPLSSAVIKNRILVLTNSLELLKNIQQQNLKPKINPYLSFTLNPWFKVNLNKKFFEAKYNYPFLADLQQIFLPLNFTAVNAYNLELDNQKNDLEFKLRPQTPASENGDLKSFISLIDEKALVSLGVAKIETITQELENNQNFKSFWNQLDNQLFLNQQLSLANLSKTVKSPIILAFGENFWQIITDKKEEALAKTVLTGYLAQFKPKEVKKILPDNTKAVELVADPAKIEWQKADLNGSQITYQDLPAGKLGWLINNDKLIISNKLDQMSLKNINFTCGADKKTPIINAFYLNPQFSKLNLNNFLRYFSYFSGVSYNDGEVRLCLGLK